MLEIVDRLSSLNQRTVVQQSYRSMYAKQEEDLNNQIVDSDVKIADLGKSIINQQKGMSTYKEILDVMSKEQIIKIQSLVTLALQNIFTDRDYSLDIVFGERGVDRTVELVLVEKKEVSTSEGINRIDYWRNVVSFIINGKEYLVIWDEAELDKFWTDNNPYQHNTRNGNYLLMKWY